MRYHLYYQNHSSNQLTSTFRGFTIMISFFLLIQCSDVIEKDKLTEGIIEYDIAYVNNSDRSFPLQLLPKTMELKFNRNYAAYTIEDRVGLFSISIITNLKKRNHLTLIKVFNKKYVYRSEKKETPIFFDANTTYYVNFLKDTFHLAGIPCKKASVTDTKSRKNYDVAYTSNIDVPNPNLNTPYKDINGLLMEFVLQMKNLKMTLTAKKIIKKKINDQNFVLPDGYKFISKKQMEEIMTTLLP